MRKPLIMGNGKINCEYAENSSVPNINFDLRHTLDFLSINTHQHMHIAAMQIVAIHCWTNLTFSKWVFVYAIFSFELYRYKVIYFSLIFCYRCHSHFKQFFFVITVNFTTFKWRNTLDRQLVRELRAQMICTLVAIVKFIGCSIYTTIETITSR